jgi:transposase
MTRLDIDSAHQVFQVHGVDGRRQVGVRKRLTWGHMWPFLAQLSPCLMGREAGATAHSWARELMHLGYEVRLMAPQCVRPYWRHPQHDGHEAEASCEAVSRPTTPVVPLQSVAQPAVLTIHRARA